jgi:hypothetical protein
VATADSADFRTAPPAATAAGRKPASLPRSMPDTGPGGPEGRRRAATTRPVSRVAGRGVHQGPLGRFLAPPGTGRSPRGRPVATPRRLGCRGHSAVPFKLPCWPAPLALQHPPGTRQGGWPGLSRHRGPVRGRAPESLSKRAARGPAAICQRTTRRRPCGPLASAGQGTRSSAGPKLHQRVLN